MKSRNLLLPSLFFVAVTLAAAEQPAPASAILVLDASGSMQEKIGGRPRIDIAKEAVRSMLETWDPGINLGLLVYGHRAKSDCGDIELVVPPGRLDKAAFLRAVDGIQPRGMTPLTEATRAAADALTGAGAQGSVILLTDGVETCKRDPCAVAAELAARGVPLKVHVIGFDLSSRELRSIECLSAATGGAFLAANDLPTLVDSMKVAAVAAAAPVSPSRPVASRGTLLLKTLASEGGKPLEAFYRVNPTEKQVGLEGTRSGSGPRFELTPGRYRVESQWGRAMVSAELAVEAGKETSHTFVLGAGVLAPVAVASDGGDLLSNVNFRVYAEETSLDGKREQVASGARDFKLIAGRYVLAGEWGHARAEMAVEVIANQVARPTLVMNAGTLKVTAVAVENGEVLETAYFRLRQRKAGLEGGTVEVAANAQGEFRVNAGVYTVVAEWGATKVPAEVEVRPNERIERPVVLNAGVLDVKLVDAAGNPVRGMVRIQQKAGLEGRIREVASSASVSEFRLASGSYLVVAESQAGKGSANTTITAGERTEVVLKVAK